MIGAPLLARARFACSILHKPVQCCDVKSPTTRASSYASSLLGFAKAFSSQGGVSNLLLRDDDVSTGVTTLTLNNPKKYNVLSWEMLDSLQRQLDNIAGDSVSDKHICSQSLFNRDSYLYVVIFICYIVNKSFGRWWKRKGIQLWS